LVLKNAAVFHIQGGVQFYTVQSNNQINAPKLGELQVTLPRPPSRSIGIVIRLLAIACLLISVGVVTHIEHGREGFYIISPGFIAAVYAFFSLAAWPPKRIPSMTAQRAMRVIGHLAIALYLYASQNYFWPAYDCGGIEPKQCIADPTDRLWGALELMAFAGAHLLLWYAGRRSRSATEG
jgi:hypothetical protein